MKKSQMIRLALLQGPSTAGEIASSESLNGSIVSAALIDMRKRGMVRECGSVQREIMRRAKESVKLFELTPRGRAAARRDALRSVGAMEAGAGVSVSGEVAIGHPASDIIEVRQWRFYLACRGV